MSTSSLFKRLLESFDESIVGEQLALRNKIFLSVAAGIGALTGYFWLTKSGKGPRKGLSEKRKVAVEFKVGEENEAWLKKMAEQYQLEVSKAMRMVLDYAIQEASKSAILQVEGEAGEKSVNYTVDASHTEWLQSFAEESSSGTDTLITKTLNLVRNSVDPSIVFEMDRSQRRVLKRTDVKFSIKS